MIFFKYQFERMGYSPAVVSVAALAQDHCCLDDVRDEILDALPSARVLLPGETAAVPADLLFLCAPNINVVPLKDIRAAVRSESSQNLRRLVLFSVTNRRWQSFPRQGLLRWAARRRAEIFLRNIFRKGGWLIRIPERWL